MTDREYPTSEELQKIRDWDYTDVNGLIEYLKEIWHWKDWITDTIDMDEVTNEEVRIIECHTGGWSGNEDIIESLHNNMIFWVFYWIESRRGGHYKFHIPIKQ